MIAFTWQDNDLVLRLIGGMLTALLLSIWLGYIWIPHLSQWQPQQRVRDNVPSRQVYKNGTPSLGGVFIIISYTIAMLFWSHLHHRIVWVMYFVLFSFGGIGLVDDLLKIKNKQGLSIRQKFIGQLISSLCISTILYGSCIQYTNYGSYCIARVLFILWSSWVIIGSTNAFNLTDGLDGLAILQVIISAVSLLILAIDSRCIDAVDRQEIAVLCSILIGSSIGFLWYNYFPPKIFMGDVGALALGAFLGTVSIVLCQELTFSLIAFIPVIETLSVIIQVISFKLTKRRIFLMAPLHHHFELLGYSEPKIVVIFSLLAILMAIVCLGYTMTI